MNEKDLTPSTQALSSSDYHLTTTSNASNSTPPNYRVDDFPEVWLYFSPFLLLVGVVGNSLIVLVMRRRRLKKTTTSVYLVALALADTAALLTRIPSEIFTAAGVGSFININQWTCRLEKFSFYTFSDIAIWILVMFTVDRFIAVCLPFYKQKVSIPRRALHIIACIVLIMVIKNFHIFWTRGSEFNKDGSLKKMCARTAFVFEQYIRPWIVFTFITLFPFVTIVVCNVSITVCLIRTSRRMKGSKTTKRATSSKSISSIVKLTSGSLVKTDSCIERSSTAAVQPKLSSGMTQTTLMCLSTSIAFLICVSPSIILTLGRVHWINDPVSALPFAIARSVNYQLSCLNHAINFFLYCLTGQRFRHELKQAMKGWLKKMKQCCGDKGRLSIRKKTRQQPSMRKFSLESTSAATVSGRRLEQVPEGIEEQPDDDVNSNGGVTPLH